MNTPHLRRTLRARLVVGVAALAAVTAAGMTADAEERIPARRTRVELAAMVDKMPAGWPATEAMRREAGQPTSGSAERARWRRDAERMPAGWPATEAMFRGAAAA